MNKRTIICLLRLNHDLNKLEQNGGAWKEGGRVEGRREGINSNEEITKVDERSSPKWTKPLKQPEL